MSELNDKAVTRRQVVAGVVGAAALLALGAGVRGAKGSGELIRPPGSVGEDGRAASAGLVREVRPLPQRLSSECDFGGGIFRRAHPCPYALS